MDWTGNGTTPVIMSTTFTVLATQIAKLLFYHTLLNGFTQKERGIFHRIF